MIRFILNKVKEIFYSDTIVRENDHLKAENFTLRRKLAEAQQRINKYEIDTSVVYDCIACRQKAGALPTVMIVCPICLDKSCPKAEDHENECFGRKHLN